MFVAIPDEEREGYFLLEEIDEPESVYVGKHFANNAGKIGKESDAHEPCEDNGSVESAIDSLLNGESERQRTGTGVVTEIDDMVPLVIRGTEDSAHAEDDGNIDDDDAVPKEIILALGEAAAPEYRMSAYERMSPFYGEGIMEEKAMHETFAAASLDRDAILGTFDDDDRRDAALVYDALYGTEATSSASAGGGAVYGGAAAAVLSFDQDKLNDIRQRIISSANELMTKRSTLDYDA